MGPGLLVLEENRHIYSRHYTHYSRHIKCEWCIRKYLCPPIRPLPPYEEMYCVSPLVGLTHVKLGGVSAKKEKVQQESREKTFI